MTHAILLVQARLDSARYARKMLGDEHLAALEELKRVLGQQK